MQPESLATVSVDAGQIVCRAIRKDPPLVVLNDFGATNAELDAFFIDRPAWRTNSSC